MSSRGNMKTLEQFYSREWPEFLSSRVDETVKFLQLQCFRLFYEARGEGIRSFLFDGSRDSIMRIRIGTERRI